MAASMAGVSLPASGLQGAAVGMNAGVGMDVDVGGVHQGSVKSVATSCNENSSGLEATRLLGKAQRSLS